MIIVFGSINIDMVVAVESLPRPGQTVLGPEYRLAAGGKGANQALAARRAGAEVRMVGRIGRDAFADLALAELKAAAVDLGGVGSCDKPTGCAMICVDGQGRNLIVVASGANGEVTADQLPDALLEPETLVVLQMEVPSRGNWAVVERARARNARILLNAAPAGEIPMAALSALDWLVLNEDEAVTVAARLGLPQDGPETAGRAIAAAGRTTAIVTLGGQGAVAYHRETGWRIKALPVNCVDTTGAGDAFVGAFAAAIDGGLDLPDALRRASIAGSLACQTPGAQPSLPSEAAILGRLQDLAPAVPLSS